MAEGPDVTVLPPRTAAGLAGRIAALTRAAYRGSDPLPGLPVPDGATETEAAVRADLASGATVWLAESAPGRPVAALRVTELPDGAWGIGRVSVLPAARGTGVARTLLDAVEDAALREGVPVLRLDAVVERCLPPLYARLGFAPVRHWPSGDKPLTEVTMERRPGAPPRPGQRSWLGAGDGVRVHWLLTGDALLAVIGDDTAEVPPGTRLAGIDVWRGDGPRAHGRLRDLLTATGRRAGGTTVAFPPGRHAAPVHLMPRAAEPRLHAWCRFRPGAELPWNGAGPDLPEPVPSAARPDIRTDAVRCT
ncbi:GNAT family N-acetyltransferase [Streptomyces sp. NPDC012825]|uniref:GNAT family N-acetyltransferase n=1 Tax=Streptomyces sp. NPDC012825 TaxID=3364851 RepID=UPI0036C55939